MPLSAELQALTLPDGTEFPGTPQELLEREQSRKEKARLKMAAWRKKNPERALAVGRRFREKNRAILNEAQRKRTALVKDTEEYKRKNRARVKAWREKFPERSKESIKKSRKKDSGRLANNACRVRARQRRPELVIKGRLRARLLGVLKPNTKAATTESLLGCSYLQLKEHLESLFQPGMTWGNRGEWEIDHIRPCASFDLLIPEQQRCCFHYTNLQPLWRADNRRKSDKCL